ncbi:MAG: WG repeat-containing protein, partial [Bacteroidales bacterium]|nr:WG repeat-containing protein [Bacteroidales bacterium]
MKKIIATIAFLFAAAMLFAQDYPVLKPISEKKMSEPVMPLEKKDKWGFADEKGRFIIKAVFEEAEPFLSIDAAGTIAAKIKVEGKWGYLKRDGTYLIPPVYSSVKDYDPEIGLAVCEAAGTYDVFDPAGTKILAKCWDVSIWKEYKQIWFLEDAGWEVVSLQGLRIFRDSFSELPVPVRGSICKVISAGFVGLLDVKSFKYILRTEYAGAEYMQDADAFLVKLGENFGICTPEGNVIIAPVYSEITFDPARKTFGLGKDGLKGLAAADGTVVLAPEYESIAFDEARGVYDVVRAGLKGVNGADGTVILPPLFSDVRFIAERGLYEVVENGKKGVFTAGGAMILATEYDEVSFDAERRIYDVVKGEF